MDDDDEPLGGGYGSAFASEEGCTNQAVYNPFSGEKIPVGGLEAKPLYKTTIVTGPQGGKKGRKRKGGGQGLA